MNETDDDETLVEKLVALFLPEDVEMSLDESENFGRKVYDGTRGYCYFHFKSWTRKQVEHLARRVQRRVEWKLSERRDPSKEK